MNKSKNFQFDGDVTSWVGVAFLTWLLITFTFGIATAWALCMKEEWVASHTIINGRRCKFYGTGADLFGPLLLWFFLTIITVGIYGFWVVPKLKQWMIENTDFEGEIEAVRL
ncbi:MAG: DUF898 family protein [Candidatus Kapaibacterium sp.]|jgi:uncharacterized membrane protein YjgN (DUF898 family)